MDCVMVQRHHLRDCIRAFHVRARVKDREELLTASICCCQVGKIWIENGSVDGKPAMRFERFDLAQKLVVGDLHLTGRHAVRSFRQRESVAELGMLSQGLKGV